VSARQTNYKPALDFTQADIEAIFNVNSSQIMTSEIWHFTDSA